MIWLNCFVRAEPEFVVCHNYNGERNHEEKEREPQSARLLVSNTSPWSSKLRSWTLRQHSLFPIHPGTSKLVLNQERRFRVPVSSGHGRAMAMARSGSGWPESATSLLPESTAGERSGDLRSLFRRSAQALGPFFNVSISSSFIFNRLSDSLRYGAVPQAGGSMIIVLMGVTGAGKTTVGQLLAAELGWTFEDADHYHPARNVEKMRNGLPLTDADRAPWLETLRALIASRVAEGKNVVLACSALKHSYRECLRVAPEVHFVYLKVTPKLLHQRLRARVGHFMTERMIDSQLADLEEPKNAVVLDGDESPEKIVGEIRTSLGLAEIP